MVAVLLAAARNRTNTELMTDLPAPPPNPETPWEFYPDDDLREEPSMAAEDAAMHIESTQPSSEIPADENPPVVHYMEDEEPEVPDLSVPSVGEESTPEVEDLLIRQHYMSPKDPK